MVEALTNAAAAFWSTLCEMAPYLLFGFLAAGLLSVLIPRSLVERHLGGRGFWPVAKASLFGIPLPLCSCSVIPVTASLRRHGASRGAATAFLLSTPQTGVDSIFVTLALLGPVFAIFRPLAALVSGLLGGAATDLSEPANDAEPAPPCEEACCAEGRGGKLTRVVSYGFVDLPRDIGAALLLGIGVAGVMAALIPDNYFAGLLGTGVGAIVVMMLVGIPVYVCATASVPVAAMLIAKGVSPGAALAFLLTGPATNAATLATVWKVMGRRTALIYLGTVVLTALGGGLLLDAIFQAGAPAPAPAMGGMLPAWLRTASAVALLAVLANALLRRPTPGSHQHADHKETDDVSEGCCHGEHETPSCCHLKQA